MGFPGALEVNNPSANAINIREVGLIPGWGRFPGGLGLTGLISLLSKEASRVLSSTTVQKQQFFGTQPSLRSNSPICT